MQGQDKEQNKTEEKDLREFKERNFSYKQLKLKDKGNLLKIQRTLYKIVDKKDTKKEIIENE